MRPEFEVKKNFYSWGAAAEVPNVRGFRTAGWTCHGCDSSWLKFHRRARRCHM